MSLLILIIQEHFIEGNEEEKQKIIKRVVAITLEGKHERSVLEMFVDPSLIRIIRKTLVSKVHDLDLEVPENYLNDIILSTTVPNKSWPGWPNI